MSRLVRVHNGHSKIILIRVVHPWAPGSGSSLGSGPILAQMQNRALTTLRHIVVESICGNLSAETTAGGLSYPLVTDCSAGLQYFLRTLGISDDRLNRVLSG